jgi:hypothetical protein
MRCVKAICGVARGEPARLSGVFRDATGGSALTPPKAGGHDRHPMPVGRRDLTTGVCLSATKTWRNGWRCGASGGAILSVLLMSLLGGCATGGSVGPHPLVTRPIDASNVTVYRDGSWVGFLGTILLRIDDRKVYRLGRNEAYTFQLDPGSYLFNWSIGFNECRRVAFIDPRRSYSFRLAPNCARFEDGS